MQADTVYRRGASSGYAYMQPAVYGAPPVQNRELFPPRFGLPHPVPTIMDVLRTTRLYPDARSATSGLGFPGYSGTARPANSWW